MFILKNKFEIRGPPVVIKIEITRVNASDAVGEIIKVVQKRWVRNCRSDAVF